MRAFCIASFFLGTLLSAPIARSQDDDRKYLLERVDDMAVVQLYIDGFDQLPLNQKQLIYHLSQAAVAGRDIFIDQKYKHSLAIRDLIEETITHAEGIDEKVLAKIRRYAKLFWGNNGPHNPITSQKNVLTCSPQEFIGAVKQAESNGAKLPKAEGESTEQMLDRMEKVLFDPNFESHVTQKSPSDGRDILIASANNLYEGVTTKDLDGFSEKYALNSRLVKAADGKLVEQVYRAGFDNVIPPGMYAEQLSEVIKHLDAAIPHATPKMARALGALIHYYRTGEPIDFREYNIAWVADTDSPVDTINGFIEVYVDARAERGLGRDCLLQRSRENGDDSQVRRRSAMVRGPYAVRTTISETRSARHFGQSDSSGDGNGRFGARDTDRD